MNERAHSRSDRDEAACSVCDAAAAPLQAYAALHRVTSDSRVWPCGGRLARCETCGTVQKPFDAELAREAAEIYATYQLYSQGEGAEQKIFKAGLGRPRSERLLDHVLDSPELRTERSGTPGRWLDVGCGDGHLLRGLAERRPHWRLYGADIGERSRAAVEAIDGVEQYFSSGLDGVSGRFDVLSLSHVLEHVPSPSRFLAQVRARLATDGHLLIAVPNWRQNPFDLLVADHCLHFAVEQLVALLHATGFVPQSVSDEVLPKELVLVARPGARPSARPIRVSPRCGDDALLHRAIAWLAGLVSWADAHAGRGDAGLLGTALAATWLDHSARRPFAFFVDEDPQRAHTRHLDRPVIPPDEVPPGSTVLVPMPDEIARGIAARLNRPGRGRYVPPPSARAVADTAGAAR